MYLQRALRPTLELALRSFPAVLLTGPRQAGKTTFVRHSLPNASYVTLDDPVVSAFARDDPQGFLQSHKTPLILDEIQQLPELLPFLKVAIDANRSQKGRFVLTGSQQFALMQGVSESLAGRIATLDLLPLGRLELERHAAPSLAETIWRGGYPEPVLAPSMRSLWIVSYLRTYLERDVRSILKVAELRIFELFLNLVAAHHGQEVNRGKLASQVGISQPTVKRWLNVLEASYVLYGLRPYHENLGKRLVKSPKLYFLDSALPCHLTRQPSAVSALAGPLAGALFEGWCVSEAVKLYAQRGDEAALYFWRSHDGLEVDLLAVAGAKVLPIEIKKTSSPTTVHGAGLTRFCQLAGSRAYGTGWVVCDIPRSTKLAGGHEAIPWREFPGRFATFLTQG